MKRTIIKLATLLLTTICTLAGANSPNAPVVLVDSPTQVSESTPKRFVGMVEAYSKVNIMPRVTGNLLKIAFKEGELIRKGDLLFELEDTTYKAHVNSLEAQKEALKAVLKFTETEFKRNSQLLKSRAVSHTVFDKARMEIDSARANLKNIDANLIDARNTLSYTKIYAPLSGRIGISAFSEGNLITPASGKMTDIEMIAPIYVRFSISEKVFRKDFTDIDTLKKNAVVRIQLADGSVFNETAAITLVDNKINPSTNTITVWATFANKNLRLIPGSLVTVKLSSKQQKKAIAIPPSALIASEKGYYIYIVNAEGKVEQRNITTGRLAKNLQIITSGLSLNDTVIIDGTHKVSPGMAVKTVKASPNK